jgi:hypothetical protein
MLLFSSISLSSEQIHDSFPSGEAPANEIRVAATQSLSTIIERALETFKTHDVIVVRGLGGAISGAVQVGCKHEKGIRCYCSDPLPPSQLPFFLSALKSSATASPAFKWSSRSCL